MSKKGRSEAIILGVRVSSTCEPRLLAQVRRWIGDYRKIKTGKRLMFTPNPEMLVDAAMDDDFLEVLNSADVNIADGVGLRWASLWLRMVGAVGCDQTISNRITGADLSEKLIKLAADEGWKVYLVGGGPNVAMQAREMMMGRYGEGATRGFEIKASEGPRVGDGGKGRWREQSEAEVRRIAEYGPDVLLVAFGHNKQEKWLVKNRGKMSFGVAMGVGGTLDYMAGRIKRAPGWVRSVGLEWLYRLLAEPWRWRRIWKAVIVFPWLVVRRS